jgi:hypothetical protein
LAFWISGFAGFAFGKIPGRFSFVVSFAAATSAAAFP